MIPFDVRNLTKKSIDDHELWQKHFKDPINVKMWVLNNLNLVFIMSNMPLWTPIY